MGLLSKLFSSKKANPTTDKILVDMHSHLLPSIDDGSKSLEESVLLVQEFVKLGYKKLITTPHIMGDFYKNTPEIINSKLALLKDQLSKEKISIEIDAAAEYYLDEALVKKLKNKEPLLTFGENYLLFETSYINEPANFKEVVYLIKQSGYWPVLAHPERYQYLYDSFEKFQTLYDQNISFQLNINSLIGYYSRPAQIFANKLVEKNMIQFVGSDCHSMKQMEALEKSLQSPEFDKLSSLYLLNNSLLSA